jgi:hypothetical protein
MEQTSFPLENIPGPTGIEPVPEPFRRGGIWPTNRERITRKILDPQPIVQMKIAILSNIHYMSPTLLNNNAEIYEPFINDRMHKALLEFGPDILAQVLWDLLKERPDIILIPGDLTKNGELDSHKDMVALLDKLVLDLNAVGKDTKIYVIPGSCDINTVDANKTIISVDGNGLPKQYNRKYTVEGDQLINSDATRILNLNEIISQKSDFFSYYGDFGYNSAVDKKSFSYLAQPHPNLWILAIDTEQFSSITDETMIWISDQLAKAEGNAFVLGLMHKNVLSHVSGEVPEVTSNTQPGVTTADQLFDMGLRVVFTGSHRNDITFSDKQLYEIETVSLVTPPCPYRRISLSLYPKDCSLNITTKYASPTGTYYSKSDDKFFSYFSGKRLAECVDRFLTLNKTVLDLIPDEIIPICRDAFIASVAGDEPGIPQEVIDAINRLNPPAKTSDRIKNFWTDEILPDNNARIDIPTPKEIQPMLQFMDLVGTFEFGQK